MGGSVGSLGKIRDEDFLWGAGCVSVPHGGIGSWVRVFLYACGVHY